MHVALKVSTMQTARHARQQALAEERTWLGAHTWGTVTATIARLKGEADTLASTSVTQEASRRLAWAHGNASRVHA